MSGTHNSGRRPQPTALKVLRGNPGHRPLNDSEPKPMPAAPPVPADLSPEERAEWDYVVDQLDSMGTLAVSDKYAIKGLARAAARETRLNAFLVANEETYEEKTTQIDTSGTPVDIYKIKTRPQVAMLKVATEQVYRFSTLLGLDPSSRGRLHVSAPSTPSESSDLLTSTTG